MEQRERLACHARTMSSREGDTWGESSFLAEVGAMSCCGPKKSRDAWFSMVARLEAAAFTDITVISGFE